MEKHKEKIEKTVERLISNEVLCNATSLVDRLYKVDDSFSVEIENIYEPFQGDKIDFCPVCMADPLCEQEKVPLDYDRDECEECYYENESMQPREILEWWIVSKWLYEKLSGIKECVCEFEGCYFWGRTCSGQHMSLDGTFERIAEKIIGQNND